MFTLTDKQIEANELLINDKMFTLLSGGARSGKTFVILTFILLRAIKYPGSRQLICRHHLADLKASVINDSLLPLTKLYSEQFGDYVRKNINKQDWYLELGNGSQLWFSGLGNEDQVEKILGREYSLIFINEATQIEFEVFEKLKTRLSQHLPGLRLKMILDCNPTTINSWIYKLFFEHRDPIDDEPRDPKEYQSLRMNPTDNQYLSKRYVDDILGQLSFRQRQRFLEGVWVEEIQGALWSMAMINPYRVSV